jgi:hypothetical protein
MYDFAIFVSGVGEFILPSRTLPCWAGRGDGLNNPEMESVKNVGPIPRGRYAIMEAKHPRFHRPAFRLVPDPANGMFGRSAFWIHGGTLSHGCIMLQMSSRVILQASDIRTLFVVHRPGEAVDLIYRCTTDTCGV